jgi:hypothetical protein
VRLRFRNGFGPTDGLLSGIVIRTMPLSAAVDSSVKETQSTSTLEYQEPPKRRRDSAWSVVGFALALLAAFFAGAMVWGLWRSRASGARISFGVTPLYYVAMAAVAAVCVRGLMHSRKRFAIAGLVLVLASLVIVLVIVRGSPW